MFVGALGRWSFIKAEETTVAKTYEEDGQDGVVLVAEGMEGEKDGAGQWGVN